MANANAELVETGDLDQLIRHVDRLCAAADWDALVDLRDRCRRAVERGKQLWPVASHAEYRLALEAPGRYAAAMLVPGAGRFALGPLSEVAASTHTWDELAPHAPPGPQSALAAHERVLRGEDLTADPRVDPAVLEVPLALASWEPAYPLATYRPHDADFGDVPPPPMAPVALAGPGAVRPLDDDKEAEEARRALEALAETWVTSSNGTVASAAVRGSSLDAIAALDHRSVHVVEVDAAHAVALMAWVAGSGGAHGRRPGMAAGRFSAWWAAAALTRLAEQWPPHPDRLGEALGRLRWVRFEPAVSTGGWSLRLAVEDPATGRAWAVEAEDRRS
jgi:hypothetical protein